MITRERDKMLDRVAEMCARQRRTGAEIEWRKKKRQGRKPWEVG